MTKFGWFSKKSLCPCALDKISLSIGRVELREGLLLSKHSVLYCMSGMH